MKSADGGGEVTLYVVWHLLFAVPCNSFLHLCTVKFCQGFCLFLRVLGFLFYGNGGKVLLPAVLQYPYQAHTC